MGRKNLFRMACTVLGILAAGTWAQSPVGGGVTYQGQLKQGGVPFEGTADLAFALFDQVSGGNQVGSTQAMSGVVVSKGLFTVTLNAAGEFGANAFNGDARWLEISVNGTPLTPRQRLNAAPYAQALPGVRTEGNASGYNVVAGHAGAGGNVVQSGVVGATVFGGVVGGINRVTDDVGTVGGGIFNVAGNGNEITNDSYFATVGGGFGNHAAGPFSLVGGGQYNQAAGLNAVIAGGYLNEASGDNSAVLGGVYNRATGDFGMCLGGVENIAEGAYSLAAGIRAYAQHAGTFVWNDATTIPFASARDNTFIVRASGGVGINTNDPTSPFTVDGTIESKNGGFKFPDGTIQTTAAREGDSAWQRNGRDLFYNEGEVGLGNSSPLARVHIGTLTTLEESGGNNFTQANFGCNLYLKDGRYSQVDNNKMGLNFNINPDTQIGQEFRFDKVDPNGGNYRSLGRIGSALTYFIADRVGIRTTTPDATLHVNGSTRTLVLEITGGSDIAEPFDVNSGDGADAAIQPGMVVAIDPECAGELRLANQPYDAKVAGVISGAGGVNPGLTLTQTGTAADGRHPVALSGRVYCWVDADANGPVAPGDLLTTSSTPGHAMKASASKRSHGAIIGKAMSSLDSGQGLVLVMVNLQ